MNNNTQTQYNYKADVSSWIKSQSTWLQKAFSLAYDGNYSESDLAELSEAIKGEINIFFDANSVIEKIGTIGTNKVLKIKSIYGITGIDKLKNHTKEKGLNFDSTKLLNIIYGSNGSGKSGYVKLLKVLSGKTPHTELRNNIFSTATTEKSFKVEYEVGGVSYDKNWTSKNTDIIKDFENLNIFDSQLGKLYSDNDKQIEYVPKIIDAFKNLAEILTKIETSLNLERQLLTSKLQNCPSEYLTSKVGITYNNFKTKNINDDILMQKFSNEDESALKALEERLNNNPSKLITIKSEKKLSLENLYKFYNETVLLVSKISIDKLKILQSDLIEKKRILEESTRAFSENPEYIGIDTNSWKAMWNAAKVFSEEVLYPQKSFPNTEKNSLCPLCRQTIDSSDIKDRFQTLENFVSGKLSQAVNDAEKLFLELKNEILSISESPIFESLYAELDFQETDILIIKKFRTDISILKEKLKKDEIQSLESINIVFPFLTIISERNLKISEEIEAHKRDLQKDDSASLRNAIIELKAKRWVSSQSEAIIFEIERQKKLKLYQTWISLLSTAPISRKAGEIAEKLITDAYKARFNNELSKLGANYLKVDIKKRTIKGHIFHSIFLTDINNSRIPTILSEGEQRVIQIAAFIADTIGSSDNLPYIFDDPISSLDENFCNKILDRLYELSLKNQVIIFTHRLYLFQYINESMFRALALRKIEETTGIVSELPFKLKNIQARLSTLSEELNLARIASDEGRYDDYDRIIKNYVSNFRITLERIIEKILLNEIVERGKLNITTKDKLMPLTVIIKSDCELLDNLMSKYSFDEHQSPTDSPQPLKCIDELNTDLKKLKEWNNDFKERKKKI